MGKRFEPLISRIYTDIQAFERAQLLPEGDSSDQGFSSFPSASVPMPGICGSKVWKSAQALPSPLTALRCRGRNGEVGFPHEHDHRHFGAGGRWDASPAGAGGVEDREGEGGGDAGAAVKPSRKAGGLKGFWIAPDFDAPLEDFKEYME